MSRPDYPTTHGIRFLRARDIPFVPHIYKYEGGGAKASAAALGVDPMRVAKTLVFEDHDRQPLVVIMNGPWEVSLKSLARELSVKRIAPCHPSRAESLTGYKVGGISPFGQRTAMPMYLQIDLLEHETIWVNGGQRGFLVELAPDAIERALDATLVDVAQPT